MGLAPVSSRYRQQAGQVCRIVADAGAAEDVAVLHEGQGGGVRENHVGVSDVHVAGVILRGGAEGDDDVEGLVDDGIRAVAAEPVGDPLRAALLMMGGSGKLAQIPYDLQGFLVKFFRVNDHFLSNCHFFLLS